MYRTLGISDRVLSYGNQVEESLTDRFRAIDATTEYNQLKVISAMQKNRVSDVHLSGTTG